MNYYYAKLKQGGVKFPAFYKTNLDDFEKPAILSGSSMAIPGKMVLPENYNGMGHWPMCSGIITGTCNPGIVKKAPRISIDDIKRS